MNILELVATIAIVLFIIVYLLPSLLLYLGIITIVMLNFFFERSEKKVEQHAKVVYETIYGRKDDGSRFSVRWESNGEPLFMGNLTYLEAKKISNRLSHVNIVATIDKESNNDT
jgi:hypothetical protein